MLISRWEIEMINLVRKMRTMQFRTIMFFSLLPLFFPAFAYALGNLENPAAGSTESGISIVSGWHCTASNINIYIDDIYMGVAKVGTVRLDTKEVCGHENSGFSFLINYNSLAAGSHIVKAIADGELLESQQFNSVSSSGVEPFVRGLSKSVTIANFPATGLSSIMQWSTSKQSFTVTNVTAGQPLAITAGQSLLDGTYKLDKVMVQFLGGSIVNSAIDPNYTVSGTIVIKGDSLQDKSLYARGNIAKSRKARVQFTDNGGSLHVVNGLAEGDITILKRGDVLILSFSDTDPLFPEEAKTWSTKTEYWVKVK